MRAPLHSFTCFSSDRHSLRSLLKVLWLQETILWHNNQPLGAPVAVVSVQGAWMSDTAGNLKVLAKHMFFKINIYCSNILWSHPNAVYRSLFIIGVLLWAKMGCVNILEGYIAIVMYAAHLPGAIAHMILQESFLSLMMVNINLRMT